MKKRFPAKTIVMDGEFVKMEDATVAQVTRETPVWNQSAVQVNAVAMELAEMENATVIQDLADSIVQLKWSVLTNVALMESVFMDNASVTLDTTAKTVQAQFNVHLQFVLMEEMVNVDAVETAFSGDVSVILVLLEMTAQHQLLAL